MVSRISGGKTKYSGSTHFMTVNYTKFFSEIKNQGACLSCWVSLKYFRTIHHLWSLSVKAFTAVSVIEYFMSKMGKKWVFSEQDLVDCSKANFGCMGGWATNAFKYKLSDTAVENQLVIFSVDTLKTKAFPMAPNILTLVGSKTAKKRSRNTSRF